MDPRSHKFTLSIDGDEHSVGSLEELHRYFGTVRNAEHAELWLRKASGEALSMLTIPDAATMQRLTEAAKNANGRVSWTNALNSNAASLRNISS